MHKRYTIHVICKFARENSCKIGRAPCGVRLIFYNASRAPYDIVAPADVFIYRRRTAPVRYVTTQEKILKNRPCPGDYQIRL